MITLLTLATAMALLLTGASFAAPPPVENTTLIEFAPVGVEGEEASGRCWTTSNIINRPGVWRCMIDNSIQDPCFTIEEGADWVVCGASPLNDGKGFRLNLTEPLPTDAVTAPVIHAWVMELADGTLCSFLTGAGRGVGGERVNYSCGKEAYIVGDPVEDTVWTANKMVLTPEAQPKVLESEEVQIKTVWY